MKGPSQPTDAETAALAKMFEAWEELTRLGWRPVMYCPKDGSWFDAIEAGSTGVHNCHYEGEWPSGTWWIADGDLWPSRPIMFKLRATPSAQEKAE